MTPRTTVVRSYFDGFRQNDRRRMLDCLADDVVWNIDGHTRVTGTCAVAREVEQPDFAGSPRLDVHRPVEEADVVVAKGIGGTPGRRAAHRFAFYDVFRFAGDAIQRVDSSRMPLPRVAETAAIPRAA